jgi:hypothetical protein
LKDDRMMGTLGTRAAPWRTRLIAALADGGLRVRTHVVDS